MKRDMGLIRTILEHVEQSAPDAKIEVPVSLLRGRTESFYHAWLCVDAGFLERSDAPYLGRLTPKGHAQLKEMRDAEAARAAARAAETSLDDIHNGIDRAIAEGLTFKQFLKAVDESRNRRK